ncbi:MAG: glycine zipper 2TM domain-containing protein [Sulfuriferula multivorans]|uniref:Glycine zipper 2TM domain-containing protein n=1 Tax=Sulfuriferula multivorans TaxID=1559896 RepID=A0A7C9P972_9PROT|nr:glycine zipper 2TM domain-containing protein [Sulfuriferula multivorans]
MKPYILVPAILFSMVVGGCSDMPKLGGGPTYGGNSGPVSSHNDRYGKITALEVVQVDENYKLGIGTAVGAVAGGLLGSQIGKGDGATLGAVLGAAAGAVAGTAVESKMKKQDAQRVTVRMDTGGEVTLLQPIDSRLRSWMRVRVEGSGDNARVVPQ